MSAYFQRLNASNVFVSKYIVSLFYCATFTILYKVSSLLFFWSKYLTTSLTTHQRQTMEKKDKFCQATFYANPCERGILGICDIVMQSEFLLSFSLKIH